VNHVWRRRLLLRCIAFGLLVALGAGRARAADPPGFPSTGTPAPTGADAVTTDTVAKDRIAALKKFARDKQTDPMYAQHEAAGGACAIDLDRRVVTLTFGADGVLHCKLPELAEGFKLDVWVLTVKSLYATGGHYRVLAKPGEALKAVPVHGSSDDVKAVLRVLSGLQEAYATADWWHAPVQYGPYHHDSITLTIALEEAGIEEQTKITITPLYSVNLGVAALVGPGFSRYTVAGGKISESKDQANLDYYFGVHVYPFSWQRNGNNSLRPGRYFSDTYSTFGDRLSLLVGINLAHPTLGGYVGAAIELYSGVSITGGWQPRKLDMLKTGSAVGDAVMMGEAVPTEARWKLASWGVGLSIDVTLLKPILGAIQ
jgi:hypothetical protein